MKRDIEWLKKEIGTEMIELEPIRRERWADVKYQTLRSIGQKIYQLDEPEVLSQELPVIPKYVAEYLEFAKSEVSLIQVMEMASVIGGLPTMKKVFGWISANDEVFARAWLDGYEVEEEPLYYALVKGHELIDSGRIYWIYDKNNDDMFISVLHSSDGNFLAEMSKAEWNKLGIDDSNADFVKIKEAQ